MPDLAALENAVEEARRAVFRLAIDREAPLGYAFGVRLRASLNTLVAASDELGRARGPRQVADALWPEVMEP